MGFFESISSFLSYIALFFQNFLNSIIVLFSTVTETIILVPTLVGAVPYILGSSISIVVAFAVVKLVIGR